MSDDVDLSAAEEARVDALLRSLTDDDLTLDTPPASVWSGIDSALQAEAATASPAEGLADVVSLDSRRRRLGLTLISVAAAFALIAGLAVVLTRGGDDIVEFASAELIYQDGFDELGREASASTTLIEADGERRIRFDSVDLPAPAATDEDLELWLIGIDDEGEIAIIQTLGVVDDLDDPGTFTVPAGFSTDAYATVAVDISVEPRDGVETHSGRSIVRGPLDI